MLVTFSLRSVLAEKMEWSVTGVQLPMVVRLARFLSPMITDNFICFLSSLFLAFYYGELGAGGQVERRGGNKEKEKEKEDEKELRVEMDLRVKMELLCRTACTGKGVTELTAGW